MPRQGHSAGTVTILASGKQRRQGQTEHLHLANAGLEADNRERTFVDDEAYKVAALDVRNKIRALNQFRG